MVDSEYSTNNYKLLKISSEVILKNPQSSGLFPDSFKTKRICKNAVEKLPFVIRYFPDLYKTPQMCGKVTL